MKIAILGNYETVMAFKALGIEAFGVSGQEDAEKKVREICAGNDCGVLLITEDWFFKLDQIIKEISCRSLPAVIPVPSIGGSEGLAEREIAKIVERAVGSDVFSKK